MKVDIKFSLEKYHETIDLEDYGFEENQKWEDLTDEEKWSVTDSITEQMIISALVTDAI